MKITIVSLWAYKLFDPAEPQPFGGAELQLFMLSQELAQDADKQVQFVTRGNGPARTFSHDGFQVIKLPYRSNSLNRSLIGSWDVLRTLISSDTDLYLQRGGGIETGLTGLASRWTGKPFFFMTSSLWDVDGTHEKHRGLLYGKTYMYGLKHANFVVTQSQEQSDLLLKNYNRESAVLRSAHRIPQEIPSEKQGVLWVGRCESTNKRPDIFIRLADLFPQAPFTMVCPEANSRCFFEHIAKEASARKNIAFLPGVSFEETERLFARHRLFVNTSEQEGFPNTFVQAFKWGTPVISLQVNPDCILSEHRIGVCAQGDETALCKSVRKFLMENSEWSEYSRRARIYAVENHDIKSITKILDKLIHQRLELIGNSSGR